MEQTILPLIITLGVLILLFFACREILMWYWKINERITLQNKTNMLLEKITIQLGLSLTDEITIEEIANGEKSTTKMDKWVEWKMKNPNLAAQYRIIKPD
ncbi:MAG: hypothetical protein NTX03_09360 [Bacteroidetes bacterium]|nr:hypothetical protein [Bacteroidota bacterium]